jgi:hypothetical protein
MKTYAIFPTKQIAFCVNGQAKQFTPEDQVGVVSVDGVSLMDLLGALQFHHCKAVELDEAEMLSLVDENGEGVLVSEVEVDSIADGEIVGGFESEGDEALEDQPGVGDLDDDGDELDRLGRVTHWTAAIHQQLASIDVARVSEHLGEFCLLLSGDDC